MEVESLADGVDLSEPLTRARFEELVGDLLKKTLGPVRKVRPRRRAPSMIALVALPHRHLTGARHFAGAGEMLGRLRADVCMTRCRGEGASVSQAGNDLDKLSSGGIWWHLDRHPATS